MSSGSGLSVIDKVKHFLRGKTSTIHKSGSSKERFGDYTGEPGWMQGISNSTICNWFYTFYLANLVVFFLVIAAGVYVFFRSKNHVTPPHLFFALLQLIVAGTNMLFFYLICDRSLKPSM